MMQNVDAVEILLVEDNPRDAELTIRALKKKILPIGCSMWRMAGRLWTFCSHWGNMQK